MSELNNVSVKELTPENIIELADYVGSEFSTERMNEFAEFVKNNFGTTTINHIANNIHNKEISILLNAVLNELPKMLSDDSVFLEKYLISNNVPHVRASVIAPKINNNNLRAEILEMAKRSGIRNTVMYYLIVMYHMG